MKRNVFIISLFAMSVILTSCVTKKKYLELDTLQKNCEQENSVLKKQNIELGTLNNELKAQVSTLREQNRNLIADSTKTGSELRNLKEKYDRISQSYDEINNLLQKNAQSSSSELQKLLAELQKAQEELQKKEDKLQTKQSDLDELSRQLSEKERRLNELQAILDRKDSIVNALKNKVLEALTGFVGKGLTVEQKNGKVYVHMDEKLLFATGSFDVADNGVEALKNLAKVLETNPDINITVEGHTDNVPYKTGSNPINDNWDLSVMRATAVVKILLKNSSVDPKRLTAAGRSQYIPVDPANTAEARSKNRRTEIILTPKLDEIFKILESN